jgi:hypothetical protein
MGKKARKPKTPKPKERQERRFQPRPAANPIVVYVLGAVGSVLMGAGAWERVGPLLVDDAPPPFRYALAFLVLGAALAGAAIWMGTDSESALRVGDGGVAVEKGGLRRMPWYGVQAVEWSGDALGVTGKDDSGTSLVITASATRHPQAAAWILREARQRIPSVVQAPVDVPLPEPQAGAGTLLPLEPAQLVGKRCEASGQIIAYEPDARVCTRCERVYQKAHVPESCACGASLASLRVEVRTA